MDKFIAVTDNGPREIGLSAASSDRANPLHALPVFVPPAPDSKKLRRTFASLTDAEVASDLKQYVHNARSAFDMDQFIAALPKCPSTNKTLIRLWLIGAIWVARSGAYGRTGYSGTNVYPIGDGNASATKDPTTFAAVPASGEPRPDELIKAVTIIGVAKTCFWMSNHHIGQGERVRYATKGLQVVLGIATEPTSEMYEAMHAMGHWVCTGGALRHMGVKGIAKILTIESFPGPSRDMSMRIASGPAGTGPFCSYTAIVKKAAISAYSVVLPHNADYEALLDTHAATTLDDARWHVGSAYLTDTDAKWKPVMEISEEAQVALSAFIHGVAPKGTLAKSKSILKQSDIAGSDVYTTIIGIKAKMAAGVDAGEAAPLVAAMAGSTIGGDPFQAARASMGKDERNVQDALAIIRAEKAREKQVE